MPNTLTRFLFSIALTTVTLVLAVGALAQSPVTVSFTPSTVAGSVSSTGKVTLSSSATAAVVVKLHSDNVAVTVPATVTVPKGSLFITFSATTVGVAADLTAHVSAQVGTGTTVSGSLMVTAPVLSTLNLTPTSVVGGKTSAAMLTISSKAGSAGFTVTLSSSNPNATVPSTVKVPSGATTVGFTVTTKTVGIDAMSTISGMANGVTVSKDLTITGPRILSVTVSAPTTNGGSPLTSKITLTSAAPVGGIDVSFASTNSAATVPSIVHLNAGVSFASVTVTTVPVATNATGSLTASLNGSSASASLLVVAPSLTTFTASPASTTGGGNIIGSVTISGNAPSGGYPVAVTSSSSAAMPPAVVVIPSGLKTTTFTIMTSPVSASTGATISAKANGVTKTASITVIPPVLVSVQLAPSTVIGGVSSNLTVGLNAPAPSGGVNVTLMSSSGNAMVASSLMIPGGSKSASTTVGTLPVAANATASISGHAGTVTLSATLTINAPHLIKLTVPGSVIGGSSLSVSVALDGKAPTGGITVNLTNSNHAIATLPTTAFIAGGTTTTAVTASTVPVDPDTTTTIGASATGVSLSSVLTVLATTLDSVTVSPTSIVGGTTTTGTVNLTGPAPTAGFTVAVTTSPNSATAPATVKVPAGASSVNFTISSTAVGTDTTVTITVKKGTTQTKTATVLLTAPTVTTVAFSPTSVVGGTSSTGTVTISSAAPTGGIAVHLSSTDSGVTTPATVTVLAGATTATFTEATAAATADHTASVKAQLNASNASGNLTVTAPKVTSLTFSPTSVLGGNSSTGTVTLSSAAPVGGFVVTLSSDKVAVTPGASVTVAAGATTATFTATTVAVPTDLTASVTGSANGVSASGSLSVTAPTVTDVSLSPTTLVGGNSSTATVTISSPAPASGFVLVVTSGNAAATVPSPVTIPAGATSTTFTVSTVAVASDRTASISAARNGISKSATLSLTAPTLVSAAFSPSTIVGGTTGNGTVTISSPAPVGGLTVTLASDNSAVPVPPAISIPAGGTTKTFTSSTKAVGVDTTATVTVSVNGNSVSGTLNLTAPVVTAISMSPASVPGGTNSTGTIMLSSAAPVGGFAIAVTSSNAAVTVPVSVTVPAGTTQVTFTTTTAAVGTDQSSTITGTANAVSVTTTLAVTAPALQSLVYTPNSVLGLASSTGTLTLATIAPAGGLTVNLSCNNANVTVPASVTVAAGSTSVTFTATTIAVATDQATTTTASVNGSSITGALGVTAPRLVSLTIKSSTIVGGAQAVGKVTITGNAPTGGIVVSIAKDSTSASMPASVTVPAGTTTVSFLITSSTVGALTTVNTTSTLLGSTATAVLVLSVPSTKDHGERVFYRNASTGVGIFTINGDGTNPQTYSTTATLLDVNADGTQVLADDPANSTNYTFFNTLTKAKTVGPLRVVGTTNIGNPRFLPDMARIAFQSDVSTYGVCNLDGTGMTTFSVGTGAGGALGVLDNGTLYIQVANALGGTDLKKATTGGTVSTAINGGVSNNVPGLPKLGVELISRQTSVSSMWTINTLIGTTIGAFISDSTANFMAPSASTDGTVVSFWSDLGAISGLYASDGSGANIHILKAGAGTGIYRVIPINP